LQVVNIADVHHTVLPADHVQSSVLDTLDLPVLDGDEAATLGACFAGMSSLKTARKDNPGVCRNLLSCMNMTQCPVLVILGAQVVELARCVGRMALAAVEACVEQTDIKHPWFRGGVSGSEIVHHMLLRKALAVYGDFEVGENFCVWLVRWEQGQVPWLLQRLG
jgi:hypothetical protein